jgi:hypothetical protein
MHVGNYRASSCFDAARDFLLLPASEVTRLGSTKGAVWSTSTCPRAQQRNCARGG